MLLASFAIHAYEKKDVRITEYITLLPCDGGIVVQLLNDGQSLELVSETTGMEIFYVQELEGTNIY